MSSNSNNDDKWYLGKNIRKYTKSSSSTNTSSNITSNSPSNTEQSSNSSKWYPGKYAKTVISSNKLGTNDNYYNNNEIENVVTNTEVNNIINQDKAGEIQLNIIQTKYLLYNKVNITIILEGKIKTIYNLSEGKYSDLTISLPFNDISSDIIIYFVDSTNNNVVNGRIIIPITSYLSNNIKSKNEWRQIYPHSKFQPSNEKFISGYENIFNSAMSRPKATLGFINTQIDIELKASITHLLFNDRYLTNPSTSIIDSLQSLLELNNQQTTDIIQGEIKREYLRFQRMLQAPVILESFLAVPEVFVLIGTLFFIFYSVSLWQLPFITLATVAYNGHLSKNRKADFSHCIVWNDPVVEARVFNSHGSIKLTESLPLDNNTKNLLEMVLQRLNYVGKHLEKFFNLWNHSDPMISGLVYKLSAYVSAIYTLLLLIFEIRTILLLHLVVVIIIITLREYIEEILSTLLSLDYLKSINNKTIGQWIRSYITKFLNFWSRIPDEAELNHRYIANSCIVKENGAEMLDAAIAKKS